MGIIFISYRRDDSADAADRICDWLRRRYGKQNVFLDVDTIRSGNDFTQSIKEYLYRSDVLLAIIGRHWAEARDPSGQRRIDQENDYVRQEIRTALDRGIPVIPLIIGGAQMPSAQDLPRDLEMLAYRNAHRIGRNPDFEPDMDHLIETLRDEWSIRPDSWRTVLWWRRARSRSPAAGTPAPPDAAVEKPSGSPASSSPDSSTIGGKGTLGESLIERIRRIKGQEEPPPSGDSPSSDLWTRSTTWYVRSGARITGPFTQEQLRSMRGRGEFSPIHQVSTDRVHWESGAPLVQMLDSAKPARSVGRQPSGPVSQPVESVKSQKKISAASPELTPTGPQWYYADSRRQQVGPISEESLVELLKTKRLSQKTSVCKAGETHWNLVSQQPELAPFAPRGHWRMLAIAAPAGIIIGLVTALLLTLLSRGCGPGSRPESHAATSGL